MTEAARNEEIREFILDNYPPASSWELKAVEDWTAWAASEGFLFLCYDQPGVMGKLVGLCIARPLSVSRANSNVGDTDYDRDGEVVYVDLTISTDRSATKAMMAAVLHNMKSQIVIAFKRLKTKDKLKTYALDEFASKILGRQ